MTTEEIASLNPLEMLLFVAADERFVPEELAKTIKTASVLLEDAGANMSEQMKTRWKERVVAATAHCDNNDYGQAPEMQQLCNAALRALEGRFYEVVEKDYLMAGSCYEQAAKVSSLSYEELLNLAALLNLGVLKELKGDEGIQRMLWFGNFIYPPHAAKLWARAGDVYCRLQERITDAQQCYERGLEILRSSKTKFSTAPSDKVDEQWREWMCHLFLSLASTLAHSGEWEKAESVYRNAADVVFFNRQEKSNKEYRDIVNIIAKDIYIPWEVPESDVTPHITLSIPDNFKERLLRLEAELGQRAVDVLEEDFKKSEEGFPVPETYYLFAALSELYITLGEYEKCHEVFPHDDGFVDAYLSWTWDELDEALNGGGVPFAKHMENFSYARGMLQRPGYKEFSDQMKKQEESHQRQELRQIRMQRMLEGKELETIESTQSRLLKENPWLESAANIGSVVTAETIYSQLKRQNWGEMVMGYCNAVEEELKRFLYKEYLAFRRERFDDENYAEESERQKKQQSILHFIASLRKNNLRHQIWAQFASTKMKTHSEFLSNELPKLLEELVSLRGPSAHGTMKEREKAEKARNIVLGTQEKPGLLKRLVDLHQSCGG